MKIIAQSSVSSKLPYLHLAYTAATTRTPQGSIFTLAFLMLIIGLILTFKTSARNTKKGFRATYIIFRRVSLKKRICHILLIILGVFLLCLSFLYGTKTYLHPKMVALVNIMSLGESLYAYQGIHKGKYPEISKWCDELLEDSKRNIGMFRHPGTGPGKRKFAKDKYSDYAINVNLALLDSNEAIPPDVVVLFEAKKGWNQAGGPELINTELGYKSGCYIYFGDGKVKFVKKEEINKLRWDIESK